MIALWKGCRIALVPEPPKTAGQLGELKGVVAELMEPINGKIPLDRIWQRLTPQEQQIVEKRALAEEPESLERAGAAFNPPRTCERARQLECALVWKLQRFAETGIWTVGRFEDR